jgi:hypothetical protein
MNKKYMLIAFTFIALALSALAFNRAAGSPQPVKQGDADSAQSAYSVPEHVIYRHLFHHAHLMHEKADKAERLGEMEKASSFRSIYKHEAELNEEQTRAFNEIADECEREVIEQDNKAKVIIDAFRARYPGGLVPNGEPLPPPSPELAQMQSERNAIILRARDRLRAAFGEEEFSRFKKFIKAKVAPNIHPMTQGQLSPVFNSETR